MASQEQFNQVLTRIDGATNEIANDLKALRDEVAKAGLPTNVEDSILSQMDAMATRLEGIAADPANPVPPAGEDTGTDTGTGTEPNPGG